MSIVDDAWDSAVGGLEWLQSVIFGEFAEHRSRSALVADMLLNFAPGVVIVTSARYAVAVIIRLAKYPEKRDDPLEWLMLAACMIVIALPLAMAAGGAVVAGAGAIVVGIAGSELGAALRAVMLLLIKEATKLVDVVRFLQKFIKGDLLFFLRSIKFTKYEKPLIFAFQKTIAKLVEVCKAMRAKLEHVKYLGKARAAIAHLVEWEAKFYAVQTSALHNLPKAVAELDARLARVLAQVVPRETHKVVASVKAEKPLVEALAEQRVHDTVGHAIGDAPALGPKASKNGPQGKTPGELEHIRKNPKPTVKAKDGINTKRQETATIESVVGGSSTTPKGVSVVSRDTPFTSRLVNTVSEDGRALIAADQVSLRAVARAGYEELDLVSPRYENFFSGVQDNFPGVKYTDRTTLVVTDKQAYMNRIEDIYGQQGEALNSRTADAIMARISDPNAALRQGLPGTHAEVRTANWMYNEIDKINPALYDPSKLTVVTYRLMPGPSQGLPFVACPNCAAILPKEAYIPTGRLGP